MLIDECVDARLAKEIAGHSVRTVPQMGWAGVADRALLGLAEASFDVLVTTDGNLEFQQNLSQFNLAVIVLKAKTNRLADLKPLVPSLLATLPTAPRGQATHVSG
ncbi:MAG TPA: DUF5615 family PIN-like protein [Pirellulales bacterium]